MHAGQHLFQESQRLNQTFTIWLLVFINLTSLGPLVYGVIEQLIVGKPWGDQPMTDATLVRFTIFMVFVIGLLNYILITARLETRVDNDSFSYRFRPFVPKWKHYNKGEIRQWEVRKFHRIKDFKGWGLHFGLSKRLRSISVWGNFGIKFHFGKRNSLLIGTQRPEALRVAMKKMMEED